MKAYSVQELSIELELSVKGVYTRIYTNKIKPDKKKKRVNLYYLEQFKKPEIDKYYPVNTIETFFIYESKLNQL